MDALGRKSTDLFDSVATVSFGPPDAPGYLKLGPLRLFGIDTVRPAGVFTLHRHENVEVVTLAIEGALVHEDSTGTTERTNAGDVQVMRAGTGLEHRETNVSQHDPFIGVQIWITPRNRGNEPSVARHHFEPGPDWTLMVSDQGAPLLVDADIQYLQLKLPASESADWDVSAGRAAYIAVVEGSIEIAGQTVKRYERAIVRGGAVTLRAVDDAHVLLLDLPIDTTPAPSGPAR